ncbi:MAG: adenylylsulfate kinase [Paraglaciecola sp.]|jgi:adenylylsulfate kinase
MAVNIVWHQHDVDKARRAAANKQKPMVIWLTGLSGSGKSTIANLLEKKLAEYQKHTYLLDGDNVRHGLCGDLGFSDKDRVENIRRISEVAKLFVDAGQIVLTAFISPFKDERDYCRNLLEPGEFVEVFVNTPLNVCEQRDPKGLYQKARQGDIKNFTGIDSDYEAPQNPEIILEYTGQSAEHSAEQLFDLLKQQGRLD